MTPAEIRAQLERVLAAESFANAGRLSRLLRYLVERTLAGEGDQLKEYVLGVEVFDRTDRFDPRLDSIVRVEARRLRSKLEEYYNGPGAADPLVITIPLGSYAPRFAPPSATPRVDSPSAAPRRHTSARWWVAAALAAAALAIILIMSGRTRPDVTPAAQASSSPSIAVLPFQHFSTEESHAMVAAQITDAVTTELARLGTVSVASRTSTAQYISGARPIREIAATLGVDYMIEASAVTQSQNIHVEARVVDGASDRKVWVGTYDSPRDQIDDLSRRIAREAAAAVLTVSRR